MRIVAGATGIGSFFCPPGHPMLFHSIEDGPSSNPCLLAGLDYALENRYGDVSERLQRRVRTLYGEAVLVRSDLWERNIYGYFRNCYATEDGNRSVATCIVVKAGETPPPIERHLGYLMVREYFPDAEPRPELLDQRNTLYGTRPCTKCGKRLQYEARVDAFAEAITAATACPEGGKHNAAIPDLAPVDGDGVA